MRRIPASPRRARGMSLIEIIIVIVLIGGVLAIVGNRVLGGRDRANVGLTNTQLLTLAGKVDQFQMDTGRLPESLEQLVSASGLPNWLGPYAKAEELRDPWGNAILYRRPGAAGPYELVSLGADGQPGGESVNADIRKP
ncbi:MAG: type II secretion system protein GspG [Arenimonas sp. SCN 70-307]|uniref:type II secretion system major pseudopilin GspG n=1 Tax=Arenimonas sp. SCN 70-307 TaxID=1660089 RepID=UPI000869EB20|nr:type II secretion system major pseudopilin GspG [Arenimonas sp. SCN 70-307]ODS63138.1 MAG: type II secretion system protein GspG [Arenimonas sp. SCN 70-307]